MFEGYLPRLFITNVRRTPRGKCQQKIALELQFKENSIKRPLASSNTQQPLKKVSYSATFVNIPDDQSGSTSQNAETIRVPNNWEEMNQMYHSVVGYPKGDELNADQSIPKLETFMKVCIEYVSQYQKDESKSTFIIETLWLPRFKRHLAAFGQK